MTSRCSSFNCSGNQYQKHVKNISWPSMQRIFTFCIKGRHWFSSPPSLAKTCSSDPPWFGKMNLCIGGWRSPLWHLQVDWAASQYSVPAWSRAWQVWPLLSFPDMTTIKSTLIKQTECREPCMIMITLFFPDIFGIRAATCTLHSVRLRSCQ